MRGWIAKDAFFLIDRFIFDQFFLTHRDLQGTIFTWFVYNKSCKKYWIVGQNGFGQKQIDHSWDIFDRKVLTNYDLFNTNHVYPSVKMDLVKKIDHYRGIFYGKVFDQHKSCKKHFPVSQIGFRQKQIDHCWGIFDWKVLATMICSVQIMTTCRSKWIRSKKSITSEVFLIEKYLTYTSNGLLSRMG